MDEASMASSSGRTGSGTTATMAPTAARLGGCVFGQGQQHLALGRVMLQLQHGSDEQFQVHMNSHSERLQQGLVAVGRVRKTARVQAAASPRRFAR